jgi:hypothetical protein
VTALEKYQAERCRISEALNLAGVAETLYNKDNIPKNLPCAILILDSETGKHGTSRQYVDTDIAWTVFLIVNAQNVSDPDSELYSLKEKFRGIYLKLMNRDLPSIEYYSSRIDGTSLVRIAKIDLLKSGRGAGS